VTSVWASRTSSLVCGLAMVAAAGIGAQGPARIAAMLAVVAVLAGTVFRPAATLAVLLTVSVIALANPAAAPAAMAGLSAAAYLVLRHVAATGAGSGGLGGPTLVAAVGFTFAGLIAAAFPLRLPWLPLIAPLAVVGIYLLATWPFAADRKS
jgi:hypothetical protein